MREFVYEIVYNVMEKGAHSNRLYHDIADRESLDGTEASGLKKRAYGTIERAVLLDAMIRRFSDRPVSKMDPDVRTCLRMGFYELEFMDSIPAYATCASIPELVREQGKRGFINAVLRGYVRELEKPPGEDPWKRLAPNERYSLPKDLWDVLVAGYGKRTTVKMAMAFLERQGETSLHIDPTKISVEEYEKKLDIEYERGRYTPDTLIVKGSPDVTKLYGYDEGYFYVQDESSQLPVMVAGIRPHASVVDVCGAPGGKSIHALMCLDGTGVVSIRDLREEKLSRIRENIHRMRYMNVEVKLWDATKPDPTWKERADVVLCDVPCSGYGIIGRKPELRFRSPTEVWDLIRIQREIVRASVSMLKPDGVLIYSTCTLNHKENDENADWIVENLGLVPESLDPYLPRELISSQTARGRIQVLPGIQSMDGFFVARFRKI